METVFRAATVADTQAILALYESLKGTPMCAWADVYPTIENIEIDLAADNLFVIEDENAQIIAAGSLEGLDEVSQDFYNPENVNACCLSRIGVSRGLQGQGLGKSVVLGLMEAAREKGFDSVRLLCDQKNLPAQAMYHKLGFDMRGEDYLFGIHWFCFEKKL